MKILWIVNLPLGPFGKQRRANKKSGLWMDALLSGYIKHTQHELVVATASAVKKTQSAQENGVTYYVLPGQYPIQYREDDRSNMDAWRELFEREKPDLIEVWGTEFTHGLCALREARGIPSVVRIQGYVNAIAMHYLAGLTPTVLRRSVTFRDIVKRDSIEQQQKKYELAAKKEAEMIELSSNVICQGRWGEMTIKAFHPDAKVYFIPLSICSAFKERRWNRHNIQPFSIICNAAGYSLKGLHVLLKAVALLKRDFPSIKLYVPGAPIISDNSIKSFFTKRSYAKYLEKLIKQLNVGDNIVWLGRLSQEELAEEYESKAAFVLCSAIENQSSSLIEAMTVGLPVIASAVGEIPEFVDNEKNGLLYRFGEYFILAELLRRVFTEPDLCDRLSAKARDDMLKAHDDDLINQTLDTIYEDVAT